MGSVKPLKSSIGSCLITLIRTSLIHATPPRSKLTEKDVVFLHSVIFTTLPLSTKEKVKSLNLVLNSLLKCLYFDLTMITEVHLLLKTKKQELSGSRIWNEKKYDREKRGG